MEEACLKSKSNRDRFCTHHCTHALQLWIHSWSAASPPALRARRPLPDALELLPSVLTRHWPVLQRFLVTLGMMAVIRAGHYIPLPGVDMASVPSSAGATAAAAAVGVEGAGPRAKAAQTSPAGVQ